jgi:hypothetical protein
MTVDFHTNTRARARELQARTVSSQGPARSTVSGSVSGTLFYLRHLQRRQLGAWQAAIARRSSALAEASVLTAVAKSIVLVGATVTALCLAALIGWQTALCFGAQSCTAISLQQVLEAAEIHIGRSYYTSSVSLRGRDPLQLYDLFEPILEMPAILPLVIAVGIHAAFYWYIRSIDNMPDRW